MIKIDSVNIHHTGAALKKALSEKSEKAFSATGEPMPDADLENEFWRLLYSLKFDLNITREVKVSYGRNGNEESKNIDIVGLKKDLTVFVECSTQKNIDAKIKSWVHQSEAIKKWGKDYDRNFNFIFYTNQPVPERTKELISRNGFVLFTPSIVEYFEHLAATVPSIAHYQFMSFVCKNQRIKTIHSTHIVVPSIRAKYGPKRYCYLFAIHPSTLLPLVTIPHKKKGDEADGLINYQRVVQGAKIKKIAKFISEQRGVFPTNIILSIEGTCQFDQKAVEGDVPFGLLKLEPRFHTMNVIDGQHRLFAYHGLDNASEDFIYVIAFDKMEVMDQVQTFVNINKNQTKVSASLMWDLYTTLLDEKSPDSKDVSKFLIASTVKRLNEEDSTFEGLIQYDSAQKIKKTKVKFTLEAFCTALEKEGILDRCEGFLKLKGITTINRQDAMYTLLSCFFFNIAKDAALDWNKSNKTETLSRSNNGLGAFIKLLKEALEYISEDPSHSKTLVTALKGKDAEEVKAIFSLITNPVCKSINALDKEQVKEWKGVGESGKTDLFKKFLPIIRGSGLQTFGNSWQEEQEDEIDQIIQELENGAESFELEAKETLLVDSRLLKKQVADGENPSLAEHKSENGKPSALDKIMWTVVGMANRTGGRIILGIGEEGKTWVKVGLDNSDLKKYGGNWDNYKNRFINLVKDHCTNLPSPEFTLIKSEEKSFALIKVAPVAKKNLQNSKVASYKGEVFKRVDGAAIEVKALEFDSFRNEMIELRKQKEDETSELED